MMNLRKLITETMDHLMLHNCSTCQELINKLDKNIKSPFATFCFVCAKDVQTSQIRVDQAGNVICWDCFTCLETTTGVLKKEGQSG